MSGWVPPRLPGATAHTARWLLWAQHLPHHRQPLHTARQALWVTGTLRAMPETTQGARGFSLRARHFLSPDLGSTPDSVRYEQWDLGKGITLPEPSFPHLKSGNFPTALTGLCRTMRCCVW